MVVGIGANTVVVGGGCGKEVMVVLVAIGDKVVHRLDGDGGGWLRW